MTRLILKGAIILLLLACKLSAQTTSKIINQFSFIKQDTLYIRIDLRNKCFGGITELGKQGNVYTYNEMRIDSIEYNRLRYIMDTICDGFMQAQIGKYIKFYNKDTIVVEEGIWKVDAWEGIYKSYYDNGIIKSKGYYIETTDENYRRDVGLKKGKWYYYNKKGKQIKVVDYSKKPQKKK